MKKNLWKRFLGNCLFRVCNQYPTTKVVVAKWGMRCKKEWFENYVGNVQLPEGLTLKLASLGENYLSFQLFWHGTQFYEPVTTLILQELLRPGDTFFDVGANIGFYSLVLTRSRPQIRVVAFEPNPKVHRLLKENVTVNAFNQITCEPLALSDADGAATLFLSQSDHSASLCSDFEEEPAGVLEVPALRLDTYLNRLSPPCPVAWFSRWTRKATKAPCWLARCKLLLRSSRTSLWKSLNKASDLPFWPSWAIAHIRSQTTGF